MIKLYQKALKDKELTTLADFKIGSWIYAENPTEEELDYLSEKFSLERGLLGDALDPYEVPRAEIEKGVTYIFTRVPVSENNKIITIPLMVAMGKDFLITVSKRPLPVIDKFLQEKIDFYTTQKTKLFLQIFWEINLAYHNFLTVMSRSVRSIIVNVEKISNDDIIKFVHYEGVINDFLADLVPTNAILQKFLSGKFLKLYEKDKELTEDLFLDNNQLIELCKSSLKNIGNIREAYSTIMHNNLNRIIKLLTALTIVLTMPTIIASFYGMNVRLPLANSPLAFWEILGVTALVTVILLFVFSKNKWL